MGKQPLNPCSAFPLCLLRPPQHAGSGFLGCTSFSIADILQHTNAKGTRPRWFWLFSQEMGLHKNEAVEMMIASSDPKNSQPDITISGRVDSLANHKICGTYVWQSDVWNGRPTYKQSGTQTPLYLFFHGEKKAWAVSNDVGCNIPQAFVPDLSATPDRCTGTWMICDTEVIYARGQAVDNGGKHTPDDRVFCTQTSMLAMIGSGSVATSKKYVSHPFFTPPPPTPPPSLSLSLSLLLV